MRTVWSEGGEERVVVSPLSLIVSAFAPVTDARRTLTPQLRLDSGETALLLVDLGRGQNRLGGSALAQVFGQLGKRPPDLDDPALLSGFFAAIQTLNAEGRLLAYHDRSDGGLWATALEMAFAGGTGLELELNELGGDDLAALFSEELGAVLQVRVEDTAYVRQLFVAKGLGEHVHTVGTPGWVTPFRCAAPARRFWSRIVPTGGGCGQRPPSACRSCVMTPPAPTRSTLLASTKQTPDSLPTFPLRWTRTSLLRS
jgi:phosphoribosylformylglycinamidine synthase